VPGLTSLKPSTRAFRHSLTVPKVAVLEGRRPVEAGAGKEALDAERSVADVVCADRETT
jgi:hypothetical protein